MAIRGYKPKDFREKDTLRKVKIQLNKMSVRSQQNLPTEQLIHIRDIAVKEGDREIYSRINKYINKQVTSLRGSELRKFNKSQLETLDIQSQGFEPYRKQVREERMMKREFRKMERELGIAPSKSSLYTNPILPSSEYIGKKDEYVKNTMNRALRGKPSTTSKEKKLLEKKIEQKYDAYMEEVKRTKVEGIDKASKDNAKEFLFGKGGKGGYFKNGDSRYNTIIEKYLDKLTVQQRYELIEVLTSEKFKGEFDSDEDSDNFKDIGETQRAINRQERIISILTNETGLVQKSQNDFSLVGVSNKKNKKALKNSSDKFKDYV